MLQKIKTYLLYGNYYYGIEHSNNAGEDIIYATLLKKHKQQVSVVNCTSTKQIKNIVNKASLKIPVFLVVNNQQVISKTINDVVKNNHEFLNNVFPNININDFYYEVLPQKNNTIVTICRKQYIDDLIIKYKQLGLNIINFSLGSLAAFNVINYIEDAVLYTSNSKILIENKQIQKIESLTKEHELEYDMNGLLIKNNYTLGAAAALSIVLNNYNNKSNNDYKTAQLITDFKQIRFYHIFLRLGLIIILSILLINYLFFNYYYKEVKLLSQTSQLNQNKKKELIYLKTEVDKMKNSAEDILKGNTSKSSFYINKIVSTLPNSILLSEINYQPITTKIKKDKAILIDELHVVVIGTSNNSQQYSNWIVSLEKKDWVQNVEIKSYTDLKNVSEFKINIKLKK